MKYQFCIRFSDIDVNSAATKAVLDCNEIFHSHGYQDYTFTVKDNSKKSTYYFHLLKQLIVFFISVKPGAVIGIQYPLLSINKLFKYFIALARLKKVKFFCVIHDLESIRYGGGDAAKIKKEVENLNYYDTVIVHNTQMLGFLRDNGITHKMIKLTLFDYLSDNFKVKAHRVDHPIVYAGNLGKSKFIYSLSKIAGVNFNVYGPGFSILANAADNVTWRGEFSPGQIAGELEGSFGLIWDGESVERCDGVLGNYLAYNNPHKCSLYLAAGLPVIAPVFSAIGSVIKEWNIGFLIDTLHDLETAAISPEAYAELKKNVTNVREKVINGSFFSDAIKSVEKW